MSHTLPTMELSYPFSIISFTTFLLFLILLFKSLKRSSSNNLPPGPWTLPLIGNIHQIVSSMPHHRLRNLANKYGPLMHLKLGEVSQIIVTSPEIAKEVMKIHDLNFSDRPDLLLSSIFSYNATDIAFAPYGEYLRQLKKLANLELLSAKRVQSFRSIREEEVSETVKVIAASEGSVVNLTHKISSLIYGITARAAFGKKNRHQQEFKSNMEEALKMLGGFCVADLFPSIGVLQWIGKAKMEKLHRESDKILQDIIDFHKNEKTRNQETAGSEDIVDVLLKLQKEQEKNSQYALTDDNIKAVIMDLFVAGGETVSGVVLWGMSEMVKNPKVMKEAQAEVRRVFDNDNKGNVDEEDMHQLVYLKSIIKEVLRLHPSIPLIPREGTEKCQINGYEIPAKSRIIVNIWAIGRDLKCWDEAETFKPERFLNSQINFTGTNFEYLPFGAGRRMCPGSAFGLSNVELILAQLLYHFDWELPNGMKSEELDMTELFGLALRKLEDLYLIAISRQSQ